MTAVEAALESLRGEYLQMPPAFSAKKVAGERAYALARRDEDGDAASRAAYSVPRAELLECSRRTRRASRVTCSAGFYVRTFAHALGELRGHRGLPRVAATDPQR